MDILKFLDRVLRVTTVKVLRNALQSTFVCI